MFGKNMPFDVTDAVYISPVWYKGENDHVLALYNFSIDDQTFCLDLQGKQEQVTVPNMTITIRKL